ncbi:MAG: TonB-dependent receptor [Pseudomonadota bacterium]
MRNLVRVPFLGAFFLCSAYPLAAMAEPIDEIVVRADLRERPSRELAASVSVLGRADIDRLALTHFEEIAQTIPNLNFAGGSNRPRYFQIRGVGERSQYEGAPNPSVGFVIDDIDFSAIGGVALTWDVEQIDVLRGPQGTRYGANAIAGLISVRGRRPGDQFGIDARVLAGGDDARAVGIALETPLGERAAVRVSGYNYRANGFRDNPFLGRDDTNGRDETDWRVAADFTVTDAIDVELTALYIDVDNGYDAFALDNGFTTFSDRPGRDAQRTRAVAARVSWDAAPTWRLLSLSSVARSDIRFSFDADWGNPDFWEPFVYDFVSDRRRIRENQSQEFRFVSAPGKGLFDGRLSWVAGVYAARLREDLVALDQGVYIDPAFGPFIVDTPPVASDYAATNVAGYGEVEWSFDERWALTAGLRIENRDADYTDSNGLVLNPSESMVGGQVSLTFDRSDAERYYLRVARGYKAGGFNLGPVPEGLTEFDAEFVDSIEVGAIWQPSGSSTSVRAAAFLDQRDDQQISTSDQLNPNDPSSFVFFIDNAAAGQSYGLELELNTAFSESLRAYASVGLLSSELETDGALASLDGREQPHAPGYTFAAGVAYDPTSGFFAGLDLTARDAFFFSSGHDQRSEAYQLVHARFGLRRGNTTVTVFGRNLTDERYAVRGFFFGNEPPNFADTQYVRLGDRRQVGIRVDWSLD